MNGTSMDYGIRSLKKGQLIIIIDDMVKNTNFLVGLAENVTPQNVNIMTKVGKGLIYVCVTHSKARQFDLPLMVKDNTGQQDRDFTVSVDHISSSTGISAFERAQTIKAFTEINTKPADFNKPGHIFPLVSKEKGLLQRIDVVEASIDLAKSCSDQHMTYLCEILNSSGEIATAAETENIAKSHGFKVVKLSEIVKTKRNQVIDSFTSRVIRGKQIGTKIGFPTANLDILENTIQLKRGVYGVRLVHDNVEYLGIMNVGIRPTFNKEESFLHYETHIFDFDKDIYGDILKVDVCFYIREEISFPSVDQLVHQIHSDKKIALNRFDLTEEKRVVMGDRL